MNVRRLCIVFAFCLASSCSSYKLTKTEFPSQPSWDGSSKTSGIIDFKNNLFEITETAKNRYIDLTKKYGKQYGLSEAEGLIQKDSKYFLEPRYMTLFAVMNNEQYLK